MSLCELTCLPFYMDPKNQTLKTRGYSEPIGQGCGYCTYYQAHQELGGSGCQDACDIDGIVNKNPQGFTHLCGPHGWCKAAKCVKANEGKCSEIHTAMFNDMSKKQIDEFYNAACGKCKESYCAGCAEGGYYNYYQLDNAYAPHILRR